MQVVHELHLQVCAEHDCVHAIMVIVDDHQLKNDEFEFVDSHVVETDFPSLPVAFRKTTEFIGDLETRQAQEKVREKK